MNSKKTEYAKRHLKTHFVESTKIQQEEAPPDIVPMPSWFEMTGLEAAFNRPRAEGFGFIIGTLGNNLWKVKVIDWQTKHSAEVEVNSFEESIATVLKTIDDLRNLREHSPG